MALDRGHGVRRDHARASAAGRERVLSGVAADHRDVLPGLALARLPGERQHVPVVLQQHRPALGDVLTGLRVRWGRDAGGQRPGLRVIEQAEPEHLEQDPGHHVVERRHRHLAGLHGRLQRRAVVVRAEQGSAGHRQVQSGQRRRDRGVRRAPVGGDEAPLFLEDPERVAVLAGVLAVDRRVAAHHRGGVALRHRRVKLRQVDLLHRPLADDRVVGGGVAVRLLVVHRVVLDLGHHILALHAVDVPDGGLAGQVRVLAVALERPPPARVTDDVHGGAEVHVRALAVFLAADHRAVLLRERRVEGRGESHRRRQLGDARYAVRDALRPVFQVQAGDAQPGVRRDVADVAGGAGRVPGAVDHGELVVEGHLGEHLGGPDRVRGTGPDPGAGGGRGRGGPAGGDADERDRGARQDGRRERGGNAATASPATAVRPRPRTGCVGSHGGPSSARWLR